MAGGRIISESTNLRIIQILVTNMHVRILFVAFVDSDHSDVFVDLDRVIIFIQNPFLIFLTQASVRFL